MQKFQPNHAVEIVAPKYGSAYRIGGCLLLTCKHLFDDDNCCKVRFRSPSNYSDKQDIDAKVIWKAPDSIDIALIELLETIETCDPVSFGQLPDANSAEKVKFEFLGFPQFLRYSEDEIKYATGLHIEGIIDVANRAPHNRLLLNIKDNIDIQPTDKQLETLAENQSPWEGTSGAAIVCNGLVIGVQSRHPIRDRPTSLEAESLARVYDNQEWCELLEKYDIDPEPKPVISVSLKSRFYQNQAPPKPSYFVERPEVSVEVKKLLLSEETAEAGTLVISAIYGLGGIGKSTLAAALAQDKAVQDYFPDGIFWATLGQQPDILSFLHQWIQTLGDYDFKPTGIDAASLQLRTLLADKKALLVVDDLWNAEDVEPFRVAGAGCKLLVTTREAPVKGAIRYDLDIMTETQSLALLTGYLKHELTLEDRKQAKILAKIIGYLPLALELAAAQVKDEISWAELIEELRAEIANLEILDRLEAGYTANEEKRKHYSLIACFNLSLKRLSPQRLQQFIWLGVLPDDVTITEKMATTLWDCRSTEAKKTLRYLRGKALLLTGVSSEQTTNYRVHDLLHDLARNLLQASPHPETEYQLLGLGLSISEAHRQLLTRYQRRTENGLWHSLGDDGYIYNQLIWHLEKAEKITEIHQLLREETAEGQNGWYSKCEKEGKTATFIKDVSKAWQLAEADFANNPSQSMGLQVRYALITTSLNSLAGNIPPKLIAELVKHEIWTPAQGLAYVRQNQDDEKRAEGLKEISPHLSPTLLPEALDLARAISFEYYRAKALTGLVPRLPEILLEAYEVAKGVRDELSRNEALTGLVPYLPKNLLAETFEVARSTGYEYYRAKALSDLAPYLPKNLLAKAIELVRGAEDEFSRAKVLSSLAPYLPENLLAKAIELARGIGNEEYRSRALSSLASYLPENLLVEDLEVTKGTKKSEYEKPRAKALSGSDPHLLEILARTLAIKDEQYCARALIWLAPHVPEILPEALTTALAIRDKYYRTKALTLLAPHLPKNLLAEALELPRSIENEDRRGNEENWNEENFRRTRDMENEEDFAERLTVLAPYLPKNLLQEALAKVIKDEFSDAPEWRSLRILSSLRSWRSVVSHLPKNLLPEALTAAKAIRYESDRVEALTGLVSYLPENLLQEALAVARDIRSKYYRTIALTLLALYLPEILPEALTAARAIRDESDRVEALTELVPYLPENLLQEALAVARDIRSKYYRTKALRLLAPYLPENLLQEALTAAEAIRDESDRSRALRLLAPYLPENLLQEALAVARAIGDEFWREWALSELTHPTTRKIGDESNRAEALRELTHPTTREIEDESDFTEASRELAPHSLENLPKVLTTVRAIGDEFSRARALEDLIATLTPANVDLSFWQDVLHALGTLTRRHFLETMPNLVPLILHFGGVVALREVHQGIREVSRWWK